VSTALNPLAVSAAGVAIFASGLVLAAHQIKLMSSTVIVASLVSLVVQPALFFAMIKVAGLSGAMAHATFVASAMPSGTPSVLFAQQYKSREAETASIMLITTLGMLVALPASIALSAYL
jgi:malonate transporter and related proteins